MPTPAQISTVLGQLALVPQIVRELIYQIPPDFRKRRSEWTGWSAHECAVHMAATYPKVVARLDQMLLDPTQPIRVLRTPRGDPDEALLELELDGEMARFDREREALLARIEQLTPDQWAITAEHDWYANYGVYVMFRHLALHDLYHAYRIEERLLRKSWE